MGDLAIKSPVVTAKDGVHLLILVKRWSKLVKMNLIHNYFGLGNDKLQIQ